MGSSGCRINRRLPFATGNPTFLLSRVGPDAKRAPVTQADVPRAGALVACLSALELRGSCLQGINFVRGRRSLSGLDNALLNLFSDTAFTSQVATGSILVASAEKLGKLRRGILSELGKQGEAGESILRYAMRRHKAQNLLRGQGGVWGWTGGHV